MMVCPLIIQKGQNMNRFLVAAFLMMSSAAFAQDEDCIENIAGQTVCGADADAVRARIRIEAALARGEEPKRPKRQSSAGSMYSRFKNTIALRSGYAFDVTGGGDGFYGGLAYTRKLNNSANAFKLDFELLGFADSDYYYSSTSAGAFLTSVMWQYENSPVQPFLSAGVGYLVVSDGFSSADAFAYQARAGVNVPIIPRLGLEGAYRYLGASNSYGSADIHGAELNLNINF